jgi:hypothetical protein
MSVLIDTPVSPAVAATRATAAAAAVSTAPPHASTSPASTWGRRRRVSAEKRLRESQAHDKDEWKVVDWRSARRVGGRGERAAVDAVLSGGRMDRQRHTGRVQSEAADYILGEG